MKPSSDTESKAARAVCFTKLKANKAVKKYTFRQGAIAPTWWKVPPVMMIGEYEVYHCNIYSREKINFETAENFV